MAPEQIDGAPADARSDLYSLGLVTWEMLTGRRPWEGESLYNVITKQKQEDLPAIDALRPGAVPQRLQYIVERMMQKRPAARWAGAEGLLLNLENWVVPADWPQWQAAHKRRRDAARTARANAKVAAERSAADMATVRFVRPPDGSPEASQMQMIERGVAGTPAAAAAAIAATEDDLPSWASEESTGAGRGRRAIAIAALALVAIGGSTAWYAHATGRADLSAVFGESGTDVTLRDEALSIPITPPPAQVNTAALGTTLDSQGGVLEDTAALRAQFDMARDSIAFAAGVASVTPNGQRAGDRGTSTAVEVLGNQSGAASAPAPVPMEASGPSVRATDDPGVVSAGGRHSCVLDDGRALCWGANDRGQLGDGEVESRDLPAAVVGELEFAQISAGLAHTCGVTRGGDAYCWGADDRGQLGDATTTSRSAPVRVNSNLNFRLVRTGSNHTCGLTTNGEVACWGANNAGQIGDGTSNIRTSPVRIGAPMRFVSVTTGWNHTCAVATDGALWCWGSNSDGQVGDGTRENRRTPQRVAGGARFTSVSAGGSHTCGVSESGEVSCWGRNAFGQLGIGGTANQTVPSAVSSQMRFTSVSVGGVHSCARTSGGQAWCWGRNTYGQLGDGSTVDRDVPVRVVGSVSFSAISATGAHTCGTSFDGAVSCWGFNVQGQLGDGTRNHLARPTRVAIPGR